MSGARIPPDASASMPCRMACDGSSGVDGTLVIAIAPVASSRHTKSENVPPVSTVTRYFPNVVLPDSRRLLPLLAPHADCVHSPNLVDAVQGRARPWRPG